MFPIGESDSDISLTLETERDALLRGFLAYSDEFLRDCSTRRKKASQDSTKKNVRSVNTAAGTNQNATDSTVT